MSEPLCATNGTALWLMRPTAVRSLRKGDVIAAWLGPNASIRTTVQRSEEHEQSRIITVHSIAQTGEPLAKNSNPGELVDRFLEPEDGPSGCESRMVRADELWKWIGVPLSDPDGSGLRYTIRSFERINDAQFGGMIRIGMCRRDRVNTSDFLCDATFSFVEHR